jgi:hypothetical protein
MNKEAIQQQAEAIAQWVIDNRYPKSEGDKLTDAEMYCTLIEKIAGCAPVGEAPQADFVFQVNTLMGQVKRVGEYLKSGRPVTSDTLKSWGETLYDNAKYMIDYCAGESQTKGRRESYGTEASNTDEAAVVTPHSSSGNSVEQGENGDPWISVKDRLPYKDGDSQIFCLVWDTYEGQAVVRPYNEYHKCWDGEDADDFYTDATEGNITHWQPLPHKPLSHE